MDDWLDSHCTNKMYDNFVHRRLHNTCDWILARSEFREWQSSESNHANLLWVNGPPGYGKTIMCARVIEHLLTTSNAHLAYFFFSSELEKRDEPFVVMRSWISQIISQNQQALDLVLEKRGNANGRVASHTDIEEIFQKIIHTIPNCVFMVDGLDECGGTGSSQKTDDRETLPVFLEFLRQTVPVEKSRVMIFSRDTQEIRESLRMNESDSEWKLVELQIRPEDVGPDAMLFSRKNRQPKTS